MVIARQALVRPIYQTSQHHVRFNSTAPSLAASRDYCKILIRKHDRPSYLQIPFFPQSARDAHLAICALNVEIVLIPDLVGNQNARIMRMQFWKDAVNDCYQRQPKAEPVSILLADVLAKGIKLTRTFFQSIVSERTANLSSPPITSLKALEAQLSKSVTPLHYLLLESLDLRSLELDHIAYHLSLCNGIVNILRGIPFRIKRNELPLPLDICTKHSLVQEDVFRRGPDAQGIKDVVLEVATRANDHLNTARKYIQELRSKDKELLASAFCVFLSAVAARQYLTLLESENFNPFLRQSIDWKYPFRVYVANSTLTI